MPVYQPCNKKTTGKNRLYNELLSSGISPDVIKLNIRIVDDIEYDPITKEAIATPIADALNFIYIRFGKSAKPNTSAILFIDEDGETWQAKIFGEDADQWLSTYEQQGKRTGFYMTRAGIGDKIYFPTIPLDIARQAAAKVSPLLELSLLECLTNGGSFWAWFKEHKEIPLLITEGAKKALAAISQGYIAVSFFGCNCGVKELVVKPELRPYVEDRQDVIIAFDRDEKSETRHKVFKATKRLASAITYDTKGKVLIPSWSPAQGKGVDDLIANDPNLFHEAITNAKPFDKWCLEPYRKHWEKLHTLSVEPTINQEFLDIPIFIEGYGHGIKAGMGQGKTTASLRESITRFLDKGLYIPTYRNSLGYNTCGAVKRICNGLKQTLRFEREPQLNHIHNIKHPALLQSTDWVTGCLESFLKIVEDKTDEEVYKHFNQQNIFIDEVDTVIKHLLFSPTLTEVKRFIIIQKFKIALKACYSFAYASSNLADWCVDILEKWSEKPQKIDCNSYSKISANLRILEATIENQEIRKHDYFPFLIEMLTLDCFAVFCDSQTCIESLHKWLEYHGKTNIIRIDSKTTPEKKIKEIIENIDDYLKNNPNTILLFTSSAESGLDISIENYFQKHYGFYFGIIEINSFCQGMGRVRDQSVDKSVWIRTFSVVKEEDLTQFAGEALRYAHHQQLEIEGFLIGDEFAENMAIIQQKFLDTLKEETALAYNLIAARNYEKANLRELTIEQLQKEGYNLNLETIERTDQHKEAKAELKVQKEEVKDKNVQDIANASVEYIGKPTTLLTTDANWEDRCAIEKARLVDRLPGFWGDEIEIDGKTIPIYDRLDQDAVKLFKYQEPGLLKGLELLHLVQHPEQAKLISRSRFAKILESSEIIPWKTRTDYLIVKALSWANAAGLVHALFQGKLTMESPEIQELIPKMKASSRFRNGKDGLITLHKALGKKPHKNPLKYAQYIVNRVGIPTVLKGKKEAKSLSIDWRKWERIEPYFDRIQSAISIRFERICTSIKSGNILQSLDTKKVITPIQPELLQDKVLKSEKNQNIYIETEQKTISILYSSEEGGCTTSKERVEVDKPSPSVAYKNQGDTDTWHNYSLGQKVWLLRLFEGAWNWYEAVVDKIAPSIIHVQSATGHFGEMIEKHTLGLIAPMERVLASSSYQTSEFP